MVIDSLECQYKADTSYIKIEKYRTISLHFLSSNRICNLFFNVRLKGKIFEQILSSQVDSNLCVKIYF